MIIIGILIIKINKSQLLDASKADNCTSYIINREDRSPSQS